MATELVDINQPPIRQWLAYDEKKSKGELGWFDVFSKSITVDVSPAIPLYTNVIALNTRRITGYRLRELPAEVRPVAIILLVDGTKIVQIAEFDNKEVGDLTNQQILAIVPGSQKALDIMISLKEEMTIMNNMNI